MMSPPNHLELNFPISGAVGARLSKYLYRSTASIIDPIELQLGMIILDINLHDHYEQDFQGAVEGLRISK